MLIPSKKKNNLAIIIMKTILFAIQPNDPFVHVKEISKHDSLDIIIVKETKEQHVAPLIISSLKPGSPSRQVSTDAKLGVSTDSNESLHPAAPED